MVKSKEAYGHNLEKILQKANEEKLADVRYTELAPGRFSGLFRD